MKYIDIQNKKKENELEYNEKEKYQLSSQSVHVILCFSKQSVKQSVNQNEQGSWILCSHGGYSLLETLLRCT
jgi:hypothetical protein